MSRHSRPFLLSNPHHNSRMNHQGDQGQRRSSAPYFTHETGRNTSRQVEERGSDCWSSRGDTEDSDTLCDGSVSGKGESEVKPWGSKSDIKSLKRRKLPLEPTDDFRLKLQEVEDMLRQAVEDRTILEERTAWALSRLNGREAEIYAVRKQLGDARNQLAKTEQRLDATRLHFQTRVAELEDELATKDEMIREHMEDGDAAKRCLDFERQRSDAQTTALTQELKAAYCQLDEAEKCVEQRVESAKSHLQSQIDDLSDILSSKDSEIEFLSKELDKADICIESNRRHFEKQTEIYSNALNAKCAEADSLRQHLKQAEDKLHKSRQQVQARDTLIEVLRKQLADARRDSQVKGRLVAKLSIADLRQSSQPSPSPVMHSSKGLEDDSIDPKLLYVNGALKCFNEKLVDTAFMCVQFLQDVQLKALSASQEDRDSAERVLGSRLVQLIVQRKVRRQRGASDTHPRLAQLVLQLFLAHWTYAVMKGSYSISQLQDDDPYASNAFHECILDILHDLASVLWVFGWRISGFDELVASLDAARLSERLPTIPIYQAIHALVRDAYDLRMSMGEVPAFLHADFIISPSDTPFDNESMEDADNDFHTLRLVSSTSSRCGQANGGYLVGSVGVGLQWDASDLSASQRGSARNAEALLKTRVLLDYTVESLLK